MLVSSPGDQRDPALPGMCSPLRVGNGLFVLDSTRERKN